MSSQLPAPPGQADGHLVSHLLRRGSPSHASGLTGAEQEPGLIRKRQALLFVTTRPNEPFRIGRVVLGCALGATPAAAEETKPIQTGAASWYGPGFHGKRTANGETFNTHAGGTSSTLMVQNGSVRAGGAGVSVSGQVGASGSVSLALQKSGVQGTRPASCRVRPAQGRGRCRRWGARATGLRVARDRPGKLT